MVVVIAVGSTDNQVQVLSFKRACTLRMLTVVERSPDAMKG